MFSRTAGKPTLKLAVATDKHRRWWRVLLRQLSGEPDCYAVAALASRAGKNHLIATLIA